MYSYSPAITKANLPRYHPSYTPQIKTTSYFSPEKLTKLESTPKKAQDEILSSLNLTKDMIFCDLGCGDASFLIKVHKKFKCGCLGIEKDHHRFEQAWKNIAKNNLLFNNVVVLGGDVLEFDLSDIDVFYMYQFPPVIASFLPKIPPNSLIISYAHEIPGRKQWKVEKNGVTFYVITPDIKQSTPED